MKKVTDLELELSRKLDVALPDILQDLGFSLPQSIRVKARFCETEPDKRGKLRTKCRDVSAENWSPSSGRLEIRFEPLPQNSEALHAAAVETSTDAAKFASSHGTATAEADLLLALDRAEARPGWSFVPLRKFRDEILPLEHLASMATEEKLRSTLNSVIDKKFVLVGRVPNPKAPQFPVTTIRLNRLMPEVKAALGQTASPDLDFHPIEIHGEPLSATILRERR